MRIRQVYRNKGIWLNARKSELIWEEDCRAYLVSLESGVPHVHEALHLRKQGEYWIESFNTMRTVTSGRVISKEEASEWLGRNGHRPSYELHQR